MMFISHPIFFSIILIIRSIVIGIICMKINLSWFFYLLVLVFLGGVIVLIIYINTLAINEKFFYYKINLSNYISMNLYESMNFISLLFLILYLLLTLVCVVKLVKFEYGPLIKRL